MISETKNAALALLADVWELAPDFRLGQLFANLGDLGEAEMGRGLGYIEDDELMAVMCRLRADLLARLQGTPNQPQQLNGADTVVSGSSTLPEPTAAAERSR